MEELKLEYKILSALTDHFPKNSKHKAFLAINARMGEILKLLKHISHEKI